MQRLSIHLDGTIPLSAVSHSSGCFLNTFTHNLCHYSPKTDITLRPKTWTLGLAILPNFGGNAKEGTRGGLTCKNCTFT